MSDQDMESNFSNVNFLVPQNPYSVGKEYTPLQRDRKYSEFSDNSKEIRKSSPDSFYKYFKKSSEIQNYKNFSNSGKTSCK